MESKSSDQSASCCQPIIEDISKLFSRAGVYIKRTETYDVPKHGSVIDVYVDRPLDERSFDELYRSLVESYDYFPLQIASGEPLIRLVPVRRGGNGRATKLLLLLITSATVALTGHGISEAFHRAIGVHELSAIAAWSAIYAISFLAALWLHEYGHLIASRRDGIVVEGPYFIPAPPIQLGFVGTLGAVMAMKSLPPSRSSLARLGLLGPLAGFAFALAIGVAGIMLSPAIPLASAEGLEEISIIPSVLAVLLQLSSVPPGYALLAHPLLLCSLVLLLVTFLNLMPVGQLDGGHVLRSYLSREQYERLSLALILALFAASAISLMHGRGAYAYYAFLGFILALFKVVLGRRPHPGAANQLSRAKSYIYLFTYLLLITLTLPIPT